ncbi:hypothetical protein F383_36945 [Gossypium arboreum]|uniref:Uncharacterized protein n=1 Tax=Gossypium arboreum TaxID=29729 RepID=A0A0B0M6S9_GOSAR|nr:hypothetical protein F383_36945 [Gossypium arboreum]
MVLYWLPYIGVDAMFQTWSYTSLHITMPMPCSKHGLTLARILRPMPCPRHGLTLAHITIPMPCSKHGLKLALYTGVDSKSQTWPYADTYRGRCYVPDMVLHWLSYRHGPTMVFSVNSSRVFV